MKGGLLNMMARGRLRMGGMTATGTESGFTITEFVVVVAIIAVLAAISVPAATTWLPNYYLRNAAMDIYSNMQFAKTEAVRLNSPYALVFEPGNERYNLASGPGADGVFGTGGDDVVVRTIDLSTYGADIAFGEGDATVNYDDGGGTFPADSVSFAPNDTVIFDSRGMCNAGSVYLQNNNKAYAVGTLMSGVLRIASWSSGAWR